MAYCKLGEKATVNYSFKGINKNYTVAANNTPIEVNTYQKRVNTSPNYRNEGFTLRFYSPNNRITIESQFRDYIIYDIIDTTGKSVTGISWMNCDSFDFNRNPDGRLNGPEIDVSTLIYKLDPKCPGIPTSSNKCSIEVKSKGIIIFQDQGECPVSFEVVCGEDCPPDTVKCRKSGYPGYCCLPCQPTKQSIINIKNIVKNINQEPVSRG